LSFRRSKARPSSQTSCCRISSLRLSERDTVVEPEHNDNGVSFFVGENSFGSGSPIDRIALWLIFDQALGGLVPADHTHFRLIGISGGGAFENPRARAIVFAAEAGARALGMAETRHYQTSRHRTRHRVVTAAAVEIRRN
jgi:hypothetical protein